VNLISHLNYSSGGKKVIGSAKGESGNKREVRVPSLIILDHFYLFDLEISRGLGFLGFWS
jgi:hypothetical protein